MEIKYDKKIDAKYIKIKQGEIAITKKEQDWLLFDCADDGDILGVEILDASKHLISIYTVKENFSGWSMIESKPLGNDKDSLGLTINSPKDIKVNEFSFV